MADEKNTVVESSVSAPSAPAVVPLAAESAPAASPATSSSVPVAEVLNTDVPVVSEVAPVDAPEAQAAPKVDAAPAAEIAPEEKPEGEAPKDDAAPEAAKPAYADFKLPETIKADPATMSAYTNVLGKYGISQEAGQELIDFHAGTMKQAVEAMAQQQQDAFSETRRGWQQEFFKQAGNRRDTVLNDAKFAIAAVIPDKKARTEFWNVMALTGAGDHPVVINAWAKAAKRLREGEAPGASLQANGARNTDPATRRYGNVAGPKNS